MAMAMAVDSVMLHQMIEMGFNADEAKEALLTSKNNLIQAVDRSNTIRDEQLHFNNIPIKKAKKRRRERRERGTAINFISLFYVMWRSLFRISGEKARNPQVLSFPSSGVRISSLPPENVSGSGSSKLRSDLARRYYDGIIKSLNYHGGYGFIDCVDLASDTFIHFSDVIGHQLLTVGDAVRFETGLNERDGRICARNLIVTKFVDERKRGVEAKKKDHQLSIPNNLNATNKAIPLHHFNHQHTPNPIHHNNIINNSHLTGSSLSICDLLELEHLPCYGYVASIKGRVGFLCQVHPPPINLPPTLMFFLKDISPRSSSLIKIGSILSYHVDIDGDVYRASDLNYIPPGDYFLMNGDDIRNQNKGNTLTTNLFHCGIISCEETRHTEFKSLTLPSTDPNSNWELGVSVLCDKYITAFLNSDGGYIYFGVADNGRIEGLVCDRKKRDEVRLAIDYVTKRMTPPVLNQCYSIQFLPVSIRLAIPPLLDDTVIGKTVILPEYLYQYPLPDLFVLLVHVTPPSPNPHVYFTSGAGRYGPHKTKKGECFVRRDGSVCACTPAEVHLLTKERTEANFGALVESAVQAYFNNNQIKEEKKDEKEMEHSNDQESGKKLEGELSLPTPRTKPPSLSISPAQDTPLVSSSSSSEVDSRLVSALESLGFSRRLCSAAVSLAASSGPGGAAGFALKKLDIRLNLALDKLFFLAGQEQKEKMENSNIKIALDGQQEEEEDGFEGREEETEQSLLHSSSNRQQVQQNFPSSLYPQLGASPSSTNSFGLLSNSAPLQSKSMPSLQSISLYPTINSQSSITASFSTRRVASPFSPPITAPLEPNTNPQLRNQESELNHRSLRSDMRARANSDRTTENQLDNAIPFSAKQESQLEHSASNRAASQSPSHRNYSRIPTPTPTSTQIPIPTQIQTQIQTQTQTQKKIEDENCDPKKAESLSPFSNKRNGYVSISSNEREKSPENGKDTQETRAPRSLEDQLPCEFCLTPIPFSKFSDHQHACNLNPNNFGANNSKLSQPHPLPLGLGIGGAQRQGRGPKPSSQPSCDG